jgi:RNA polymerase sigma factor (sigma-70 family)
MYLGKSFSKSKSVKSFVKRNDPTYPKELKPEELEILIGQLRSANSKEVETALFNAHVRIGMNIVGKYAYQLSKNYPLDPNMEDDLINEMCMGIIIGIKRAVMKLKDNNITGFIILRIHKRLSSFIKKEYKSHKRIIDLERGSNKRLDELVPEHNTKGKKNKFELRASIHNKSRNNNIKMIELMEIINLSIKTEAEQKVFNMREQGYRDHEIASELGVTRERVNQIRSKIRKRFKRYVQ